MGVLDEMNNLTVPGVVWDRGEVNSQKGLHIRRLASGRMGFYLLFTTKTGVRRRPKIGDIPGTTLSDARRRAKALWDQVYAGTDPVADWLAKKGEITVTKAFERTLAERWNTDRYVRSGRYLEVQSLFRNHIKPQFGNIRLSDLKTQEIRQWHLVFGGKTVGNRALEVLSTIFKHAQGHDWVDKNYCDFVQKSSEIKRKRLATPEELSGIIDFLLKRAQDPSNRRAEASVYILALALSGARPESLALAKWSDLEVQPSGVGVISFYGKSSHETGELETTVVPKIIMDLLESFPKKSDFIFNSKAARSLWEEIRNELCCPDLWMRDLRRTFASFGFKDGIQLGQIGEALNHRSLETTKRYARAFGDSNIQVSERIAQGILALAKEPVPGLTRHP